MGLHDLARRAALKVPRVRNLYDFAMAAASDRDAARREANDLRAETKDLRAQAKDLRAEVSDLRAEANGMRAEANDLRAGIANERQRSAETVKSLHEAVERSLAAAQDRIAAEHSEAEARIARISSGHEEARREAADLRSDLAYERARQTEHLNEERTRFAETVKILHSGFETRLAQVSSERDAVAEQQAALSRDLDALKAERAPVEPAAAPRELIAQISSGANLDSDRVRDLAAAADAHLAFASDKLALHRDIGKAIFARGADLYCGKGLPSCLTRFTYPAFLSVLLNTHCNAACFFCREADYKGTSIEFDQIFKLGSAIQRARVVDLTGWGEPFLNPDFERTVEYCLSINPSPHLIQVTSNGSLLNKRWGSILSGKVHYFVISLNAASAATYDAQMRYKNKKFTFDLVVDNLRAFLPQLDAEDRKRIDLHMVANSDNFREIPDFVRLAGELGIPIVSIGNYISAQPQYVHKTLWNVKQEYNDTLDTGRELGRSLGVQVHGRRFFSTSEVVIQGAASCMAPFEQVFIEPSGTTAPSCFMGTERMGLAYDQGFEAVWFSDKMNKLRKSRSLPPCKVCTIFTPFDDQRAHISGRVLTDKKALAAFKGVSLPEAAMTA